MMIADMPWTLRAFGFALLTVLALVALVPFKVFWVPARFRPAPLPYRIWQQCFGWAVIGMLVTGVLGLAHAALWLVGIA